LALLVFGAACIIVWDMHPGQDDDKGAGNETFEEK
jgi:hypothetical protein